LKEERLYEGNHKLLTDSEARTILDTTSLDEARNRIAEARQEGTQRILQENDGERSVHQKNERIYERRSVALYIIQNLYFLISSLITQTTTP